ncbi:MAG: methylated-DNA--[protein]-cysteine S-methyltransferase [Pseudomonadota bacterium]
MTEPLYYTTHRAAIGELLIVGTARGVRYLTLLADGADVAAHLTKKFGNGVTRLDGFFATATTAIDRYLTEGSRLRLPFDLDGGTPLQRMVWLEIARIPYGETISYTTLAERVGFPRAVRAVASACGANPVPLLIPCHRVLAKDGTLGGFSLGGLETKEYLLLLESQKAAVAA